MPGGLSAPNATASSARHDASSFATGRSQPLYDQSRSGNSGRRAELPAQSKEIERQEGAVSKAVAGENGKYGRVGDARRITLAVVYLANNVQGKLSAHTVTVSNLHGKKIARMIECVAHEP